MKGAEGKNKEVCQINQCLNKQEKKAKTIMETTEK